MHAAAGVADHLHQGVTLHGLVGGKTLNPLASTWAAKEKGIHEVIMAIGLELNNSGNIRRQRGMGRSGQLQLGFRIPRLSHRLQTPVLPFLARPASGCPWLLVTRSTPGFSVASSLLWFRNFFVQPPRKASSASAWRHSPECPPRKAEKTSEARGPLSRRADAQRRPFQHIEEAQRKRLAGDGGEDLRACSACRLAKLLKIIGQDAAFSSTFEV
jgi:hypothetical protein